MGMAGSGVRVARTSGRWEDPSALSAAVVRADNADNADNGLRVGLCVNHRHRQTRSTATGRAKEVLAIYKRQAQIEKRFSHIKTQFEVAPVFLKSVHRVVALLTIYYLAGIDFPPL